MENIDIKNTMYLPPKKDAEYLGRIFFLLKLILSDDHDQGSHHH